MTDKKVVIKEINNFLRVIKKEEKRKDLSAWDSAMLVATELKLKRAKKMLKKS